MRAALRPAFACLLLVGVGLAASHPAAACCAACADAAINVADDGALPARAPDPTPAALPAPVIVVRVATAVVDDAPRALAGGAIARPVLACAPKTSPPG